MGGPAPKTVASFDVERELARGGMGVVYLALQPALERRVVLKTLRRDLADDASLEERFLREAQAAACVHHQNVVAVYDCFAWRGRNYIAQEYVDGADLASALAAAGPLPPRLAALIALDLARGLEAIHARGVVHRDLKPSNVLLGKGGDAKIADFGIAYAGGDRALTQTGQAVGTPRYMSPEQLYGERVDYRSDLFSLGVVLYEMLTGRPPFEEEGEDENDAQVRRIETGRFPSVRKLAPGTPRALARLARSCLRAKPKRRPQSASAVQRRLERQLGHATLARGREEISAWLWERGVFQPEKGETTPLLASQERPRRALRLLPWAAAAACAALAAGAIALERGALGSVPLSELLGEPAHEQAAPQELGTAERSLVSRLLERPQAE